MPELAKQLFFDRFGEDVCRIQFGRHMAGNDDVGIPQRAYPTLSGVDVFKLGMLGLTQDKQLACIIVHLQYSWFRELDTHVFRHVAQV